MISRDTKVGKMLKEYPQTLDVLLATSTHFSKLQNPLLRKTLAPRVTIEQAAKIAGVNLSELLQKLNLKIGANMSILQPKATLSASSPQESRPPILNNLQPVELDVRPILQGGVDPLKTILKTVEQLAANEYLHLINSFEPIPLYAVLGKRGFDHFTEFDEGVFHVHFYRRETSRKSQDASEKLQVASNPNSGVPAREKSIELDVRQLAPPEPMMKILEALPQIDEKTLLLVHHHREPLFLYEKLQGRGYKWHLKKIGENYFHFRIWKEVTSTSKNELPILDVRELVPVKRHPLIFQTFDATPPGKSFVLINDHDPKPLYYQFKFEQENKFTWEYLEQGPEVWRVAIGKAGASA